TSTASSRAPSAARGIARPRPVRHVACTFERSRTRRTSPGRRPHGRSHVTGLPFADPVRRERPGRGPAAPESMRLPAELRDQPERHAVYVGDDLDRVPELAFAVRPKKGLPLDQWIERTWQQLEIARRLNSRQTDGFVRALVDRRPDLAGLPFLPG